MIKMRPFITKDFFHKYKHLSALAILLLVIMLLIVVGWFFKPREYSISGAIMGTTYHVKYITKRQNEAKQHNIAKLIYAALSDVDNKMSTYKPTSELMRLNNWPVNKPFKMSTNLAKVIKASLYISSLSDGFYDPTVGPLVNLWGFGPQSPNQQTPDFVAIKKGDKQPSIPEKQKIKQAMQEVGYQFIDLNMRTLTVIKKRKLYIDLSSIAKGFSVDQVASVLDHLNIHRYMVEVGGEIRVKGKRLDRKHWRVAIRSPQSNVDTPYKVIALKDRAMATSGDYLNYYNADHTRYSHEINPKTGFPEKNNIASVTVICSSTMSADAFSTMFMVLPREKGRDIAEENDIAVYIIYRDKNDKGAESFSVYASPAFVQYLT